MPVSWATLFRALVLFALSAHEMAMYRLARTMRDPMPIRGFENVSDIVLACLFALAMLAPLVWAVTLPELPEIYTQYFRAKRRFRQGRCPRCGYVVGSERIVRCPECGADFVPPKEYAVSRSTIRRFLLVNVSAWMMGCAVGEFMLQVSAT